MRVAPGRAGRLRLRRRLATAHRASELLDRKLRILRREQERLELLTERTGRAWATASKLAELWTLRATLIAGQRGIRLATVRDLAGVSVEWTATMGTRHPAAVAWHPPETSEGGRSDPLGTAALYQTRDACQQALDAAVRHAAATGALRIIADEAAATRMRLRAIEHRSVPRLRDALGHLELSLAELEHADAARLHRAGVATIRGGHHDQPYSSRRR